MTHLEIQALLANGVTPAILIKSIHDAAWCIAEARIWSKAEEQVAKAKATGTTNPF